MTSAAATASTSTTRTRRARGGVIRGIWGSTARRAACSMNLETTRMNEYEYLPDWAIID